MASIIKVKDSAGNWINIPAVKGDTGSAGPAAGFGPATASVNSDVGTPEVVITTSGPDTAKEFDFEFKNLKGDRGYTPQKGTDYFTPAEIAQIESEVKSTVISDIKWTDLNDKPFNTVGSNLSVNNGALNVLTTDDAEEDNTRPITSKGVQVILGNLDAILGALL